MGDLQRVIEAKLRITQEGDVETFGKTADEIEKLAQKSGEADKAATGLGKAWEKASSDIASGSTRSAADVAKVGVALENYAAKLKAAEAAGATIGEGQRAQLAALQSEYGKAVQTVAQFEVAEKRAQKAIEDATLAAGGHVKAINSVDDLIRETAESLGDGVAKWAIWGTAAAAAFSVGYGAGTKLKSVLDDLSDNKFSENMKASFRGLAEAIAGADKATDALAAKTRIANEAHYLLKKGIDITGMSLDEIDKKFNQVTGAAQAHAIEIDKADMAYKKWQASLPPVGKALDDAALHLADFVKKFSEGNKELTKNQLAEAVGKDASEMVAKLKAAGQQVPPILAEMAAAYERLHAAVDTHLGGAAKAHDEHVKAMVKALQEWVVNIGPVTPALANAAAEVRAFAAPWVQAENNMSLFAKSSVGVTAALGGLYADLANGQKTIEAATTSAEKLRRTLEGVGKTAKEVGPQVASVFKGYGDTGFNYDPAGVNSGG